MKLQLLSACALGLLSLTACGGQNGNDGADLASWQPGGGGNGTGAGTATTSSSSATSTSTSSTSSSATGQGGMGPGGSAAGGSGGAAPATLDLHDVTLYDNPNGLADWPVTTTITDLEFQYMGADGVHLEFSKKDGPDSWPDVIPPGWDGPLEYTLGMAELINGQWYGAAAIQFWRGLEASGGNVALDGQIAKNWYYDGRWGELAGRQPATGEVVGMFVVAGNTRGVTDDGSQSPVHERSNVVLVPMPDVNGAIYTF